MKLDYRNSNPISDKWIQRYNEQSKEVKNKLDILKNMNIREYQLKVIKKKNTYPQIGEVFIINPQSSLFLWGVVINNYVNNINGENLLVIMIFNEEININKENSFIFEPQKLLIPPTIVGSEYWKKGYFFSIGSIELPNIEDMYGFYDIIDGVYFDEYGKKLEDIPRISGIYGVSTISGVAYEVNKELLVRGYDVGLR